MSTAEEQAEFASAVAAMLATAWTDVGGTGKPPVLVMSPKAFAYYRKRGLPDGCAVVAGRLPGRGAR